MLLSAPAGIFGGMGIVWMGWSLAHAASGRVDGAHLETGLRGARGGGATALAVGSGAVLVPAGGPTARLHTDLVAGRQLRLKPGLTLGLGLAAAELSSVAVVALGAARPAGFLVAMILLGLCAAGWVLGQRVGAVGAALRWVAGWCAILIGAHLATAGFAALSGAAPSFGGAALWSRGTAAILFAAGLTLLTGNGTLIVAASIAGAAGGALGTPLAAAALVGVRVGHALAPLGQVRGSHGDGRRAMLGSAVIGAFQGGIGLLVIGIGLPMLARADSGPAMTLVAFELAFLVGATLATLPFLAPLAGALDDRVEEGEPVAPFTTDLPSVAALTLQDQALELKRLARHQARAILAEKGVTGFRMEVDLAAARDLAQTSQAQAVRLLEESLHPRTASAVLGAQEIERLPDLIEQLADLENDRLGWLVAIDDRLTVRLRDAELSCLHLIQDQLAVGAEAGQHAVHAALVIDHKLVEVEQGTLAAVASGRLDPGRALSVLWRVGRLRRLAQLTVQTGAAVENLAAA